MDDLLLEQYTATDNLLTILQAAMKNSQVVMYNAWVVVISIAIAIFYCVTFKNWDFQIVFVAFLFAIEFFYMITDSIH